MRKQSSAMDSKYQVFASVSPILRTGIRKFRDKLVMGLTSCKVYDRQHTKRCNNCQMFGHFVKDCPTPNSHYCGKCSANHRTDSCSSNERKCINCIRNNIPESAHCTFDHKCPSLKKYQEHLNLHHNRTNHHP